MNISVENDFEKQQDDERHHYIYQEVSLEGKLKFKVNWEENLVKIGSYDVNKIKLIFVDDWGLSYDDYWEKQTTIDIHRKYTNKIIVNSKLSSRMKKLKLQEWYRIPIIPMKLTKIYYDTEDSSKYFYTEISFNKNDKTIFFKHLDETYDIIQ